MSESKEEMEKRLRKVFIDPQVAAKVTETVVNPRPEGYHRGSNLSYYKESYALWLKPSIDEMMKDGQDILFSSEEYRIRYGVTPQTLFVRISQAKLYLIDRMDPDGKYKAFFEKVTIGKKHGMGTVIRYKREFIPGEGGVPTRKIESKVEESKWKRDLSDWMDNAHAGCKPYCKENLALTPEEVEKTKFLFKDLPQFMPSITCFSIKVICINPEEFEK